MNESHRLPTLFIPHGGGPCFFIEPPPGFPHLWDQMAAYLRGVDAVVGVRPRAALVISGHWETASPAVNVRAQHTLLFDYYGFPEHTYQLTYPAAGSPGVAARVRELLAIAGLESREETERGLDHGVFVPFKLIYPDAGVPIVQVSLPEGGNAADSLALGRALAPLRDQGVLIVGSGMSYHNLRRMFSDDPRSNAPAEAFDEWLFEAVVRTPATRREERLLAWRDAPGARESHPAAEHLLPLDVAAAAGYDEPAVRTYSERLFGKPVSGFQFGAIGPKT